MRAKRTFVILLFTFTLLLVPLVSCEDFAETLFVDCGSCYRDEPNYAEVVVELSITNENPFVPITVYFGNYEDGVIAESDTAYSAFFYFYLPVDKKYTFKATYKKDGLNYYVINGTKLRTRLDTESCSNPCYYVIGDEIDLRKKF